MYWPDDATLDGQPWSAQAAWPQGPTLRHLIVALRPAMRAAFLLGHRVEAIEIGFGEDPATITGWRAVDLTTLAAGPDPAASADGPPPRVRLRTVELTDRTGRLSGSFAIPCAFPIFNAGPIFSALVDQVVDFVENAIELLIVVVSEAEPPERGAGHGLLWTLVPTPEHWPGMDGGALEAIRPIVAELRANPVPFLRGQLYADRAEHIDEHSIEEYAARSGPANLCFLQRHGSQQADPYEWDHLAKHDDLAHRLHTKFWRAIDASLLPPARLAQLSAAEKAPTWLDAFTELVTRRVIRIPELAQT